MTIAKIIRARKDEIVENWIEMVKQKIPEVKRHDKSAIENSVPDLIDAIVDVLESEDVESIKTHSQKHALQRSSFEVYSLKHIIQEYNLLKTAIFKVTDESSATPPQERDEIMHVVDRAIELAAETFFRIKQNVHVDARKMAEQKADEMELKDEHREEFIHSLSHDLNNPLNNIKSCISLMEGDLAVEDVNKILEILKVSSQQAESLIKDFLNVNTVSSDDKLPVQRGLVNVLDDLKDEIAVYRVTHRNKMELSSDRDEILVELDMTLVRRAFNNLVNNALKHGDANTKIDVACNLKDDTLSIAVHNRGGVIPDSVLKTIFNRYYQINEKGRGWGIGLTFVKEVAEAHGGEVLVESNEKDGTTFEMLIPVK